MQYAGFQPEFHNGTITGPFGLGSKVSKYEVYEVPRYGAATLLWGRYPAFGTWTLRVRTCGIEPHGNGSDQNHLSSSSVECVLFLVRGSWFKLDCPFMSKKN